MPQTIQEYYLGLMEQSFFTLLPEYSQEGDYFYRMLPRYGEGSLRLISFNDMFMVLIADYTPKENFEKVSENFATFVSILGSIVSMNIVTPIVRNKIASVIQAKALGNNETSSKIEHSTMPARPIGKPALTPIAKPVAVQSTNHYMKLAQQHYSRTKI